MLFAEQRNSKVGVGVTKESHAPMTGTWELAQDWGHVNGWAWTPVEAPLISILQQA
jgi:hypothetical protein